MKHQRFFLKNALHSSNLILTTRLLNPVIHSVDKKQPATKRNIPKDLQPPARLNPENASPGNQFIVNQHTGRVRQTFQENAHTLAIPSSPTRQQPHSMPKDAAATESLSTDYTLPSPNPTRKGWLDKVLDAVVGESDGPQHKYALICEECFTHNGLALPADYINAKFKCMNCGFLNVKQGPRTISMGLRDVANSFSNHGGGGGGNARSTSSVSLNYNVKSEGDNPFVSETSSNSEEIARQEVEQNEDVMDE